MWLNYWHVHSLSGHLIACVSCFFFLTFLVTKPRSEHTVKITNRTAGESQENTAPVVLNRSFPIIKSKLLGKNNGHE